MKKILIIEDDMSICRELAELLENAGYEADILKDYNNSKEEILGSNADLLLLDINIPGVNGEQLLKEIRKESDIPVIMVTSRTSEIDEVLSMSYGADDYITKPYNPTILLLRIGAILKRTENVSGVQNFGNIKVNAGKGVIYDGDRELCLTKNEMLIFQMLLNNRDKIVSRDELMTNLWDNNEYLNDNALTVNISRLRNKLADFGYKDIIETRKKQGYMIAAKTQMPE